jgi:putative DNA primase/helicase
VQEPTIRSFFEGSGNLARGTGFLARFLLAWPTSTQGTRLFTKAPADWPCISEFHKRLTEHLNKEVTLSDDGALEPTLIHLSADAKESWIAFHDRIEGMLKTGGELSDVRDVASKIADNAARIALLLQMFCEPDSVEINEENIQRACVIAEWHLNESRRFFGELALSPEDIRVIQLDNFLIRYCKQNKTERISKSHILKSGPKALRSKATLESAIKELHSKLRAELVHEESGQWVYINSLLLD